MTAPATHFPRTTDGALRRWTRLMARRRGRVLLAWLAVALVMVLVARRAGGTFATSFSVPGTESQHAFDLLAQRFPQQAGDTATLVFADAAGITAATVQPRVSVILQQAAALPGVVGVRSPFDTPGAIAQDGRIAYATLQYAQRAANLPASDATALLQLVDRVGGNGLTVEAGGPVVGQGSGGRSPSQLVGIGAAVVILLIAFGSVVAMGLPLAIALTGLVVSAPIITLTARWLPLPSVATVFGAMLGLGVGIDYALLVVTRYRQGLHQGLAVEDSIALAIDTAGRAVAFAGGCVAVALLGMYATGIPFVGALGLATALVVAVVVLAALTLLPALLAFIGQRIDRWRVPVLHSTGDGDSRSIWFRLSVAIQRHPAAWLTLALVPLVVLTVPAWRMRLGTPDAGNTPTSSHTRRAYDLLARGFGPGFNGPLALVVDVRGLPADTATALLSRVRSEVAGTADVVQVSQPALNPARDTAVLMVTPGSAPQAAATQALVTRLRTQVLPPALAGSRARAYISGATALFIDIGNRISSHLPLILGGVIGASFILLLLVFRSVVVPVKAAVMNLLSIGVGYGVLVAIFQWGWGAGLFHVKPGPIESFLPVLLFAVLFGLSMDYEVFLISRVREEYLHTHDNATAVARGLAATARVISAAAAIMVLVFLGFAFGGQRQVEEFGVGLATAIFVDATVVRLMLVPATMELLGTANWWLPAWLSRHLPQLSFEGQPGRPGATEVPVGEV